MSQSFIRSVAVQALLATGYLGLAQAAFAQFAATAPTQDGEATFSIVAHDAATGETGVAIKSRSFRTARGAWARPDVGAVVSQASKNLSYGAEGLRLLQAGLSPAEVVQRLADNDSRRAGRQMAVVDVHGRAAAYTGADNWYPASHILGNGFAVQGNGLDNERVVPAVARAFREAKGELAERMLAALEAGQALGGDGQGYGSAGISVVKNGFAGEGPASDPTHVNPYWVDIRVDYSRNPLKDLHFLLRQTQAGRLVAAAQDFAQQGKMEDAVSTLETALVLRPDDALLWYRLAERYADAGRLDDAIRELGRAIASSHAWKNAVPRSLSFQKVRDDPRFVELFGRQ